MGGMNPVLRAVVRKRRKNHENFWRVWLNFYRVVFVFGHVNGVVVGYGSPDVPCWR